MPASLGEAVGQPIAAVRDILASHDLGLDDANDTKVYADGATFYCFYTRGAAIGCANGRIESIDLYKKSAAYSTADPALLPEDIELETTAKQFVEKFGEPTEKGGGRTMDIWLRWSFLEVQLRSRDWDDSSAQWSSLSLLPCSK